MAVSARALRAGKAVIELSLLIKPLEQQMKKLSQRLSRSNFATPVGRRVIGGTGGAVGGVMGAMARGGGGGAMVGAAGAGGLAAVSAGFAAVAAAAAAATTAVGVFAVKLASGMEMASAQLGTFTSTEAVAKGLITELLKFSAVGMQSADALGNAAAMMLKFNIAEDQVLMTTKALAVVAAGNSEEFEKLTLAYAQVAQAGKLTGEEFRQLKNTAFNPVAEIARKTGETMDQVWDRMKAGKIPFQEVANALQSLVGPGGRFAGLLQRIAATLGGQFMQAIANLKLAVLPLGEALLPPLTLILRAINGSLIPAIGQLINDIIAWGKNFAILHHNAAIAFRGIAQALAAGDIQLAADVMWAGLRVVWLEGIATLQADWLSWKEGFITTLADGLTTAEKMWAEFEAERKTGTQRVWDWIADKADTVGAWVEGNVFSMGSESAAMEWESWLQKRIGGRAQNFLDMWKATSADFEKRIGLLNEQSKEIHKQSGERVNQQTDEARDARQRAVAKLEALQAKAGLELGLLDMLKGGEDFGLGKQWDVPALEGVAKDVVKTGGATLDTRLAAQMFGGNSVQQRQLKVQEKIEENTRRGGFGIPAV